jgi:hypothetical protein
MFTPDMIAPCGMNCGTCKNYLAYSRGVPQKKGKVSHCSGCLPRGKNCFVKRGCKKLSSGQFKYCFECAEMPCDKISRLEKRYRERYATSFVQNLKELKEKGIAKFLQAQENRFKCPNCGDVVSVHDNKCYKCNKVTKIAPNFYLLKKP